MRSLGSPERYNKTLGYQLRCFIEAQDPKYWDEYIDPLVMAFRNAVHSTTGHTPQFLVFGHDMLMPFDLLQLGTYVWNYDKPDDYVRAKLMRLTKAWDHATKKMLPAQRIQKKYYDRKIKSKHVDFQPGDLVLLRNYSVKRKQSKKFTPPYLGLFRIDDMEFPNAKITPFGSHKGQGQKVNIRRLQYYNKKGLPAIEEKEEEAELYICPQCKIGFRP